MYSQRFFFIREGGRPQRETEGLEWASTIKMREAGVPGGLWQTELWLKTRVAKYSQALHTTSGCDSCLFTSGDTEVQSTWQTGQVSQGHTAPWHQEIRWPMSPHALWRMGRVAPQREHGSDDWHLFGHLRLKRVDDGPVPISWEVSSGVHLTLTPPAFICVINNLVERIEEILIKISKKGELSR